jgi:DNA-binding protein H-NS
VNILVSWREQNLQIKEALKDFDPPSVTQSMTSKPTPSDLGDLLSLSVEDLWLLREQIGRLLTSKISAELAALGKRLEYLKAEDQDVARVGHQEAKRNPRVRRPYPPVRPRYQNPSNPCETWSGRGKRPRWLMAQLVEGKRLDDFRINVGLMKPVTNGEMVKL